MVAILASDTGYRGLIYTTDLGSPVRIVDLAGKVKEQLGSSSEIVITKPRPGEKVHEEITMDDMHPIYNGLLRYPIEFFTNTFIRSMLSDLSKKVDSENDEVRQALKCHIKDYSC